MSRFDRRLVGYITREITDPDAGANIYYEITEDTRVALVSFQCVVTSDANTDIRRLVLDGQDGHHTFAVTPAPGTQIESEAITYNFAPCVLGIDDSDDLSQMWAPLCSDFYLDPGMHFEARVLNIQTGDQISGALIRLAQHMPA